MRWHGADGLDKTAIVYEQSLKRHWSTIEQPGTSKFYTSINPFLYDDNDVAKMVMEPLESPTMSLTANHLQTLQRFAFRSLNNMEPLPLQPEPPNMPLLSSWAASLPAYVPQFAQRSVEDFAAAVAHYHKIRSAANAAMATEREKKWQGAALEKLVADEQSAVDHLDEAFRNAFPQIREISDLCNTLGFPTFFFQ